MDILGVFVTLEPMLPTRLMIATGSQYSSVAHSTVSSNKCNEQLQVTGVAVWSGSRPVSGRHQGGQKKYEGGT